MIFLGRGAPSKFQTGGSKKKLDPALGVDLENFGEGDEILN